MDDLFDIENSWIYGKNKNWKIRTNEAVAGSLPVISGVTINNGISYYTTDKYSESECFSDSLTISTRGEYSGTVTYHEGKFLLANNILVLNMNELSKNQKLFIGSLINKLGYGGYSGYPRKDTLKTDIIKLPTIAGNIDFDFMNTFIAKLKTEHISGLSTYLKSSGLYDYKLTKDEEEALDGLQNKEWKEYKIDTLFKKLYTKKIPYKAKDLPDIPIGKYILPSLTSSFKNQGLNYFVPKDNVTILKNVISIPSNSDVYRAYFQSREFTVLSDAYAVDWKFNEIELTKYQYLFMVMCINKVTDLSKYSYKMKLGGWNIVKNKEIVLPVKNGKIDYIFMDTLIKAISKLTIRDVVKYVDSEIDVPKPINTD